MSAEDNIWSAISGVTSGISSVLVPHLQEKYRAQLKAEDEQRQLEINKELARYEQGLKPPHTNVVVDEYGNVRQTLTAPGELAVTKIGDEKDYISGSDILLGRPDFAGTVNPEKKYNKAMLPFLKPLESSKKETKEGVDARWTIGEVERILPLNEKSSGGFLGAARQKGMSLLNIEDEKFRNTADVVNSARSLVAKVLKSTFGGQLSDSEREYLNTVYGAMPNYSIAERRIALNNVKRMMENKIRSDSKSLGEPFLNGDGELKTETINQSQGIMFSDPGKQRRYEEWKRSKNR